jgi:acetolactate synthase-1/2/3 large subunit
MSSVHSGDAVAAVLAAAGVRRFYTVPGESFLEILDGVDRHPDLQLVSTRHEGGAAFMADADAKVTGRPAAVGATRGVGAANLAIGLHTALQDSTPMVALLGQVESGFLGREAFQEVDLPAFLGPITKHAVTVYDSRRIPELLAEALEIARSGRPGPVALAFPADVLAGPVEAHDVARAVAALGRPIARPAPDPGAIDGIARLLAGAERPVIVAGSGARAARRELRGVAERFGAGVYASFRRQDVFDNAHPHYLGHIGLGTAPECLTALREADVVLVAGSRLNEITSQRYTLPAAHSRVAQIDIDPSMIGRIADVEIGLVADAGAALAELAAWPGPLETAGRTWQGEHQLYLDAAAAPPSRAQDGCDPAVVIAALTAALPQDTIIANDAGNFSAFLHRHWSFRHARSAIGPANGAMGYGVPAAVGAKLAAPDRTVVGCMGDGGFLMSGLEIETAVRYGLDLVCVVFRNGLHGTIAMHQAREVGRLAGTRIGPVDFAALARSLGAYGVSVTAESQLDDAVAGALAFRGPAVIEVHCDPDLIAPDLRLTTLMDASGESSRA